MSNVVKVGYRSCDQQKMYESFLSISYTKMRRRAGCDMNDKNLTSFLSSKVYESWMGVER